MTTRAMTRPPTDTPWGRAQDVKELADGVWMVSAPSHGGVWLSPDRMAKVPKLLKHAKFAPGPWFEWDQDILVPVVLFPEAWKPHAVERARSDVWAAVDRRGDGAPALLLALFLWMEGS